MLGILLKIRNIMVGEQNIGKLIKRGLQIGKNVYIGGRVNIDPSHCWLISIGDNCTFADRVIVLAHDASTKRHLGYTKIGKVCIGNRTFIGAGSIILPGVSIGEDVIVGAGSVVTKDIPSNSLAMGNPATVIGTTSEYIQKHKDKMNKRSVYSSKGWTLNGGITDSGKKQQCIDLESGIGYVE